MLEEKFHCNEVISCGIVALLKMRVLMKCVPFLIIFVVRETIKADAAKKARSFFQTKRAFPNLEDLGAITKWMSDPLPKMPMKPTLRDDWNTYMAKFGLNQEARRVEERVNSLTYSPNINNMKLNCFALNFGWPAEIHLPSISVSVDSNKPATTKTR